LILILDKVKVGALRKIQRKNLILEQILTETQESIARGRRSLAVFDLDSTLFDVSPRIQRIVDELALHEPILVAHPEVALKLKQIVIARGDWGIKTAMMRLGLFESHPELASMARDFWAKKFFSNEYLKHDIPYPGAVEFVQTLNKLGADIVYLTGRDQVRMGVGSEATLLEHGFPLGSGVKSELVLKPQKGYEDYLFKSEWFNQIAIDQFDHVWFFENEPVNIEQVRKDHPRVKIIFFDSTHSGRGTVPTEFPIIEDYICSL
jgi:hypothetical protein